MDALIDEEADDTAALSDQDREKAEATIVSDLLALDRDEVALVELGVKQGINIQHRADISPLALLGVDLVTPGRPSALSLVSRLVGSE